MANGAGRIFNVFKNTAENTTNIGNQYVILEVVSTNPLQFKLGDKLIITEEFIVLSSLVDINLLTIGSKVQALVFNNNQLFYILNNRSFTQVIDNLTSEATDKALSAKQGKVLKGLIDNTYTSSEIDDFLSKINNNVSNLNSTKLNNTVVSDIYDSTKTYAVGDYCIYENTLYKCITAITTAESFNSNKWRQTNIEMALLPTGGATRQILAKKSNTDNDVEWVFNDGGVTGDTLPIGATVEWPSDTVPLNWLLCNGQAVSRITYADLFSVLGTQYGSGDGSTTFNLPDLRKRIPVGKDSTDSDFNALGKTGGEKTHQLTVDEMPSHSHQAKNKYLVNGDAGTAYALPSNDGVSTTDNWTEISQTGGGQPHNNLQPYITLNFIIKAKQSAGVIAQVLQESDTANTLDVYSSKAIQNLMKASFCKMTTNFESKTITDYTKVEGFKSAMSYGDYVADVENSRLVIKNTKLCQLAGLVCGIGNNRCNYGIFDSDGNEIIIDVGRNVLYQFAGNGYFQAPLPTLTIELNPLKIYYIYLYAVAYNSNAFYLNAGFGADGTWISATKIA